MMQVSKKIPFDDPQVLMGVRAMYILSNLIILGIYLYIGQKINAKKGEPYKHYACSSFCADSRRRRHDHSQIR